MLDATTIQALAGFLAVLLAAGGLVAGFIYWHIRDLKTDVGRLDDKISRGNVELREECATAKPNCVKKCVRWKSAYSAVKPNCGKRCARWRSSLLRGQAELREEIRRGNAQLLAALNGHTHDPDTGAAVFHEVPTAADDD